MKVPVTKVPVTKVQRLSALELVDVTLDDGSFVRWDTAPVTVVADEM